ncbi:hypothetical protein MMC22_010249 [Lobaria immixta]|nr:hypothetical protein [Lobaria immixta]
MPEDVKVSQEETPQPAQSEISRSNSQLPWFTTPEPIKRLFKRFPLRTYTTANELPKRKPLDRSQHNLYIFTADDTKNLGSPSFNPSCLKWQAYLKFMGIRFSVVPSNNHASPTGALPFLLPSSTSTSSENSPAIPSTKLQRWARAEASSESFNPQSLTSDQESESRKANSKREEPFGMRYEAYMSLVDRQIRHTWLYFLYLEPSNFAAVAYPSYIAPCSSNVLVRASLGHNLRAAAKSELLKHSAVIDVESLYKECERAFAALSELLGDDRYFFAKEEPDLFDASVFAYTNVLLDGRLAFKECRMVQLLRKYVNLARHRRRIHERYFPEY